MKQKQITMTMTVVIGVVVAAIVVFTVARRNGPTASPNGGQGGAQQHHHYEDDAEMQVSGILQDGHRVIEVTARQFEFDPGRIVVNKGETIQLEVVSEDVTHGIYIEGYDIDEQLEPDEPVTITFDADKEGRFVFRCSVYCGAGHSDMDGELIVLDAD